MTRKTLLASLALAVFLRSASSQVMPDPGMQPVQLYTNATAPVGIDPIRQLVADVNARFIFGAQARQAISDLVAAVTARAGNLEGRATALEARAPVPGPKGDTGGIGPAGPAGAAGIGSKGDKGDTGAAGASIVGPKGDTGGIGPAGPAGVGLKGDTGATGGVGPAGAAGASVKGDKGDTGAVGPAGASITGATGPQGSPGLVTTYGTGGLITGMKCWKGTVTTTTGGAWTANYSTASFTAAPTVQAQAVSPSAVLSGLLFATMTAPTTTTVSGVTALAGVGGLGGAGAAVMIWACGQ